MPQNGWKCLQESLKISSGVTQSLIAHLLAPNNRKRPVTPWSDTLPAKFLYKMGWLSLWSETSELKTFANEAKHHASVTARGIKLGNPANITNRSTAARRARASVIQTLINWSCRQHLKAGPRLLSLDFCSVTVSFSLVGFFGHHLCLSFHLSPAPPAVKTPAVPSAELSCSSTMHQLQVASRKFKGKIWSSLIKIIESCHFVWYKGVKGY